jgi:diaminohydroxyphosphoribosylaminopyrimidine deaminase/5-amino-6-(5-phosphoribosylamino)uracil reductase
VLVYTAAGDATREASLHARGATLVPMAAEHGKVDLSALLADLAQRGVNELHVEAGHKLNASLLREGLVDELLVYLAPTLLGIGREMAAFGPLGSLADALEFEFTQVDRIGSDLRILARPPGRAHFLDN